MARERPSGLPQARRAPVPSCRLSVALSAVSTSTPARHGGSLSASELPAPMPTPLAHLPALMEERSGFLLQDTTFFGQLQAGDNNDETALMGIDFNYQQQKQQQQHGNLTFTGFGITPRQQQNLYDETALFDDTVMLQKRAMSSSQNGRLPGVGLGERVLEMLMQQPQQPTSASVAPQAVLQRLELGNSQLGREGNGSVSRRRSSVRRNERLSVGPGGASIIEFETDVRFGDDLLGEGQKSTTPELEDELEPEPEVKVELQQAPAPEVAKEATPKPFRAPQRPKMDFLSQIKGFNRLNLAKVALADLVPNLDVEEEASTPARPAEDSPPFAQAISAERCLSRRLESAPEALPPTVHFEAPENAEVAASLPRRERRSRQRSVSSVSSVVTAASSQAPLTRPTVLRRKSSMKASTVQVLPDEPSTSTHVVPSSSDRSGRPSVAPCQPNSRRTSLASTSAQRPSQPHPAATERDQSSRRCSSLRQAGSADLFTRRASMNADNVEEPTVADVAKHSELQAPQSPEEEEEQEIQQDGPEHDLHSNAASEASFAVVERPSALQPVASSPMRLDSHIAGSPARSQQGDQDPFTSIAASPQIDRTRRRGGNKDRLSSSVMSRRNLTNLVSLSPVVEEKSISKSRISISELDKTPRMLDVRAMQAVLEARLQEEDQANLEMQRRIEELQRKMQETEELRLTVEQEAEASGQVQEEEEREEEHQQEEVQEEASGNASRDKQSEHRLLSPAHLSFSIDTARHPTQLETMQAEIDDSSSDEDIQAPVLQSFIGTSEVPEVHMQSPVRSLKLARESTATLPAPAEIQVVVSRQRSSVFDRLAPPHQERPSSRTQVRPRSRQSSTSGLTVAKPYERPSSRNRLRSADTRLERPIPRPVIHHQPKSASILPREPASRDHAAQRGRTVSVPVNFSPKATKPKRIPRDKSNDDMFARHQRDRSRGPGSGSDKSASRPASRAASVASLTSSRNRGPSERRLQEAGGSAGKVTSISFEPSTVPSAVTTDKHRAKADKEKILTEPKGFSFAQPRQREKRKRAEEPIVKMVSEKPRKTTVSRRVEPAMTHVTVLPDIATRCQRDNEAHEDEIVIPLTREALKVQDQINESMRQEASLAGPLQELDKTTRSETVQKYLKELREMEEAEAEEEDRNIHTAARIQDNENNEADEEGEAQQQEEEEGEVGAPTIGHSVHFEQSTLGRAAVQPVFEALPTAKRARREEHTLPARRVSAKQPAVQTAPPPPRSRPAKPQEAPRKAAPAAMRQPLQPSRAGNVAHKPIAQPRKPTKPIMPTASAARATVTTAQPFTFSTSNREQASFQQRLATWQEREQRAVDHGRAPLRPMSHGNNLPSKPVKPYVKKHVETREFHFASDKRMEERRAFEERLREKERILEELAVIRRAEAEAKEAEEIRQMRAKQVPIAHPVPRHIYGERARR